MAALKAKRRGLMLVLSSPSGAGKSTLSRRLLSSDAEITLSISATTRPPRPGEQHGADYFFVSHDRFQEMIRDNELLEHAVVFDNRYGTPKGPVNEALAKGQDVLFDVDWQGTQQLAQAAADSLVRVYLLPPSLAELEARLKKRNQDSADVVEKRMAKALTEISRWDAYDYVLVNDDFDATFEKLQAILTAERLKRMRQPGLADFVRTLEQEDMSRVTAE